MLPDAELERIALSAFPGARVQACAELKGGISARAAVVELVLGDGARRRVVVRRPSAATPQGSLRVVQREHALLTRCTALGIPAPAPYFVDQAAPALVLGYLDGAPDLAPANLPDMLEQMATQLARIHRVPTGELGFLPRRSESAGLKVQRAPQALDASLGEARLRAALSQLWPWEQHNPDVLLHGDYWPGNLLWQDGKLVAVLDWEEAELGDPLADVALARLDICWVFGEAAMHAFTELYRARSELDWRNLARWDLCIALRPMSNLARWAQAYVGPPIARPDVCEPSMRDDHQRFVAQALCSLGLGS